MAKKITVDEEDIVVVEHSFGFGMRTRRTPGDIVRVLDTYTVARFNLRDGNTVYREICDTCQGTGFRPEFAGLYGGECFPCRGIGVGRKVSTGTPVDLVRVLRRRQQGQIRRDNARQAAQQARRDEHGLWLAARPDLADALADVRAHAEANPKDIAFSPLLRDLAAQGAHRVLSPKQCDLALKMYAEGLQERQRRQKAAAKRRWLGEPGDKVTFTGTLVYTTHAFHNFNGYERASTLYLLADDTTGARVKWWRTGYWNPEPKTVYTLTGTIKELADDPAYGKCTILTRCKIEEDPTDETADEITQADTGLIAV